MLFLTVTFINDNSEARNRNEDSIFSRNGYISARANQQACYFYRCNYGCPQNHHGLMFAEAIGVRIDPNGSTLPLFYGEVKIDADDKYHPISRTQPSEE
jgi:hypothetical protein